MPNGVSSFFLGAPAKYEQLPTFTGQQQSALNNLLSQGQQRIQNPYEGFDPIAQYAQRQFNQEILPSINQNFTNQTGGALSSGALQSQRYGSATDLAERLAAMRSIYGNQQSQLGLQQLGLGLTPQFQYAPQAAQPGFLQNVLPSILPLLLKLGLAGATGGSSGLLDLLKSIG